MDVSALGSGLDILLSASTSVIVSYLVAGYASRIEFRSRVDRTLIRKRERVYKELWQLTSIVPTWPKAEACTYEDLRRFSELLRAWYFTTGGMYLSEEARGAYGKLQEALAAMPARLSVLTDADYEAARKAGSALRTELTRDLFSRKRAVASGTRSG